MSPPNRSTDWTKKEWSNALHGLRQLVHELGAKGEHSLSHALRDVLTCAAKNLDVIDALRTEVKTLRAGIDGRAMKTSIRYQRPGTERVDEVFVDHAAHVHLEDLGTSWSLIIAGPKGETLSLSLSRRCLVLDQPADTVVDNET